MARGVGFDRDNLDFEDKKTRFTDYLKKGVRWFLGCSVIAIVYYAIFSLLFSNEQEKRLMRETRAIQENIASMEQQMDMLDGVIDNLQAKDQEIYKNIFKSDPPYFNVEGEDFEMYLEVSDTVVYSRVARRTASKLSELEVKMGEFGAILEDILSMTADSTGQLRKIPGVVPVENFSIPKTGATVGMKMHPFYKTITQHTGLDIVTSAGTKVFAAADGVVESVVKSQKGKGNQVIINHGNGYVTTYSHLTNIVAKKGQRLKRGDILGRVGTSGTVFAPHLHYEVIYNGEFMNPIDYFFVDLNPVQYREMMMIGLNTGQSLD